MPLTERVGSPLSGPGPPGGLQRASLPKSRDPEKALEGPYRTAQATAAVPVGNLNELEQAPIDHCHAATEWPLALAALGNDMAAARHRLD